MIRHNDEPVYEDFLDHHALARRVGHHILRCQPPYVVGICGSWGAGKTSFLRKLWIYLGEKFPLPYDSTNQLTEKERKNEKKIEELREKILTDWFCETRFDFKQRCKDHNGKERQLELIWFNPWQHQFESSPLIALLNEIRRHFSAKHQLLNEAGKISKLGIHATLKAIGDAAKGLKIPLPTVQGYTESRREYEAENFSEQLTSQRFRDLFEEAINEITGGNGLLVIFIDDLDRCEGDVAYRLLEALKLHLNTKNCVYVLGLDQQHLEESIARTLSGEKETWQFRYVARDYLNKMFQGLFVLPVPRRTSRYVETLLNKQDEFFWKRLEQLFEFNDDDWPELVAALDENLPHNPRKIKSFISSWKLFLDTLPEKAEKLDWRLTLVLHYLAQFEEQLFRKVEEAPEFYEDHIVRFCKFGENVDWRFKWIELPYESSAAPAGTAGSTTDDKGGISTGSPKTDSSIQSSESTKSPHRVFWISPLIRKIAAEVGALDREMILRHLPQTGDTPQVAVDD